MWNYHNSFNCDSCIKQWNIILVARFRKLIVFMVRYNGDSNLLQLDAVVATSNFRLSCNYSMGNYKYLIWTKPPNSQQTIFSNKTERFKWLQKQLRNLGNVTGSDKKPNRRCCFVKGPCLLRPTIRPTAVFYEKLLQYPQRERLFVQVHSSLFGCRVSGLCVYGQFMSTPN
jgi:hypothetical protein